MPTVKQVPYWTHRRDISRKRALGTSGAALGPAWPRLWMSHWGWELGTDEVGWWWDNGICNWEFGNSQIRFLVALAIKHHQRVLQASGGARICLLTRWVTEGQ